MDNVLKKEELADLIEDNFVNYATSDEYKIIEVYGQDLLTWNRLDIAVKTLYLEMLNHDVDFATKLYKDHIRAFSLGKYSEPGDNKKNNLNHYYEAFENIFNSIKNNGFDCSKTIIPLSKNSTLGNGSHRVASSIVSNKKVMCVKLSCDDQIYNYKFFLDRKMSTQDVDLVVNDFIERANNVFIALVWPSAKGGDEKLMKMIPNIIYRKDVRLNYNGAHNLLSQVYYNEPWVGGVENNFNGVRGKLVECFISFLPVKAIAFQANSLEQVLKIKHNIRSVYNIGKHSIHITDTKEEAIRLGRLLFNDNSLHFLNFAKPNLRPRVHKNIAKFKLLLKEQKIDPKNVLIKSDIVLSLYNKGNMEEVDYFTLSDENVENPKSHKNETILNPNFHFYYNDLKFVSYKTLFNWKKNEKDISALSIMRPLIKTNRLNQILVVIKQSITYKKVRVKINLIKMLKRLGLFKLTYWIFNKLRG